MPQHYVRSTPIVVLLAILALCLPVDASADASLPLAYDLRVDLPVTLIGASLWLGSSVAQDALTPQRCHWCRDNALDRNARDALRWNHPLRAGTASDVLVTAAIPVVSLGGLALARFLDRADMRDSWVDVLIVLEAGAVSVVLNEIVKLAVARERPYVHNDAFAGQQRGAFERSSFYSSHTNIAFVLASSAGMVASLRGYRGAPVIWSVGMAAASVAGYARVAGDYHYLSDVLVGAALGSLIGMGLPWLMHRPRRRVEVSLSAGAGVLTMTWRH
jgi:membrane-associated phospholipid phosphatase